METELLKVTSECLTEIPDAVFWTEASGEEIARNLLLLFSPAVPLSIRYPAKRKKQKWGMGKGSGIYSSSWVLKVAQNKTVIISIFPYWFANFTFLLQHSVERVKKCRMTALSIPIFLIGYEQAILSKAMQTLFLTINIHQGRVHQMKAAIMEREPIIKNKYSTRKEIGGKQTS